MLTRRRFLGACAAGAIGLATSGCRKSADITIGSKNFQEQWILAALLKQRIERDTERSARTKDLSGNLCHQAITAGKIDCYVEYTGTAYTDILGHEPIRDAAAVYERVRAEYRVCFDLLWLPPLGFENTFAILVRRADAEAQGLRTISDLRKVAAGYRPGFGFEFYERKDGYGGLTRAYELTFGREPKQMKLSQTYRALAAGEVDVIAGNSTDGLIAHLDLVMLEDDRGYFPPYQAAPVLRAAVAERHPEVRRALEGLGGTITTERMRESNHSFDRDQPRSTPEQAAADLLMRIEAP